MQLKFSDLFDGLGSGDLRYSGRCADLAGREVALAGYLSGHAEHGHALLVSEPGACPDCSPAPVACLALPGFAAAPASGEVRVRGRLAYGFSVDAHGRASFLRLEDARLDPDGQP